MSVMGTVWLTLAVWLLVQPLGYGDGSAQSARIQCLAWVPPTPLRGWFGRQGGWCETAVHGCETPSAGAAARFPGLTRCREGQRLRRCRLALGLRGSAESKEGGVGRAGERGRGRNPQQLEEPEVLLKSAELVLARGKRQLGAASPEKRCVARAFARAANLVHVTRGCHESVVMSVNGFWGCVWYFSFAASLQTPTLELVT